MHFGHRHFLPSSIAKDHIVRPGHLEKPLAVVDVEPALRAKRRCIVTIERAIVAVHGPSGVAYHDAAGDKVILVFDIDRLASGRGDAGEDVRDWWVDLGELFSRSLRGVNRWNLLASPREQWRIDTAIVSPLHLI